MQFTGANTYTGATEVDAGTLLVGGTGSIASTQLNAYGGVFEDAVTAAALPNFSSIVGTGTINTHNKVLTLATGGTLAPGNSGTGVLTLLNDLNIADVRRRRAALRAGRSGK